MEVIKKKIIIMRRYPVFTVLQAYSTPAGQASGEKFSKKKIRPK